MSPALLLWAVIVLTMLSHPTVAYPRNSISSRNRGRDRYFPFAAGSRRRQHSNRRSTPVGLSTHILITLYEWDDIPLKELSLDYDAVVATDNPDGPCFIGPDSGCPEARNTRDEYVAAVKERLARGQVFFQWIPTDFRTWNDTDASRSTVQGIESLIDQYGYNGIMVLENDFDLVDGDLDIGNPTTPALVNFISAMKSIKAKYGDGIVFGFILHTHTMQFSSGSGYQTTGAILAVIYALHDDRSIVCAIPDNPAVVDTDAWVKTNNFLRGGFPVNDLTPFPPFDNHQIVLGMTPDSNDVTTLQSAIDCITRGVQCDSVSPVGGPSSNFGGVLMGSANETTNSHVRTTLLPQLDKIGTQDDDFWKPETIAAVAVPTAVVLCVIITVAAVWLRRRHQRRRRGHLGSDVQPYGASAVASHATSDDIGGAKLARLEGALKGDTLSLSTAVSPTPGSPDAAMAASESGGLHDPEHPRIVALQTEMSRVGFSVDALLASLSRLRTPAVGPTPDASESDDIRSDAPPPTYGTQ